MFKLIKGTLDELEERLNAAVAEGYTQVFREFPLPAPDPPPSPDPGYGVHGPPPAPDVYAFMMKKPDTSIPGVPSPDQIQQYAGVFRELMVALGLSDRFFPPVPRGGDGGAAPS